MAHPFRTCRKLRAEYPFYQLVSVIGSVLLLSAYGGLQTGVVKADSYFYQIGNLLGAACLTYSVISPFNSGVFITKAMWTLFSIVGLYKLIRTARRRSGTPAPATAAGPADAEMDPREGDARR